VIVRHDGSVAVLHEKALSAKLELLYSKSLFLVALNLAQSEEVGQLLSCSYAQAQTISKLKMQLHFMRKRHIKSCQKIIPYSAEF